MKILKKLVILSTFCLSSMIVTTVFAANTATVNSETARMRSEANTTSSIVTLISMNEKVDVLEEKGNWCKIKYNGKTGYISKSLLDIETKGKTSSSKTNKSENTENKVNDTNTNNVEQTTTNENAKSQENVNNGSEENQTQQKDDNKDMITEDAQGILNAKVEIRILPLINSSKITTINENSKIKVIEVVNNWCSIQTETEYGWVLKSTLETVVAIDDTKNNNTEKVEDVSTEEENKDDSAEETSEEANQEQENSQTETSKEETKTSETNKKGYVNVDTVNVRKEKSTTSTIITSLNKNAEVEILGEEDNWTKVKINGNTGFIASKYISDKKEEVATSRGTDESRNDSTLEDANINTDTNTNTQPSTIGTTSNASTTVPDTNTQANTTTSNSKNGSAVVAYAKQFLGCKYVLGGNGPKTFDCSGFTSYVYKHFGVTLSRSSSGQRSNGKEVEKSNLQPGDIVCFTGHVGIYIGGNKFIHAANAKKGVVITSLSDSYYVKSYITARRIF